MLKIRLMRTGRKNQPTYRIVVMESSKKRDGKYIDNLGYYNPAEKPTVYNLDEKKYQEWINKGAQPTETIKIIALKSQGKPTV